MTVNYNPQTVSISVDQATMGLSVGNPIARDYRIDRDPYEGDYEITPTGETQTLATDGKRMTGNIVINPVPSNYGRIDWNGQYLVVS